MRPLVAAMAALALSGCTLVFSEDNARSSGMGATSGGSGSQSASSTSGSSSSSSGSTGASGTTSASDATATSGGPAGASATSGSGSAGSGSGTGGSTGAAGPEPQLILPSDFTDAWVSLTSPAIVAGGTEVVALTGAAINSTASSPELRVFWPDGGLAASGTLAGGCTIAFPRAVAFSGRADPDSIGVIGTTSQGSDLCVAAFSVSGTSVAIGPAPADVLCPAALIPACRQPFDLAGTSSGDFYAVAKKNATEDDLLLMSGNGWSAVQTGTAAYFQVETYPPPGTGDTVAVLRGAAGGARYLDTWSGDGGFNAAVPPLRVSSFDLGAFGNAASPTTRAVFGGANGLYEKVGWTDQDFWDGGATLISQPPGEVVAVATNGNAVCYLYRVDAGPDGDELHVARDASCPGSSDHVLPGSLAPILPDAGLNSAGRQIAMMRSGAVFFLTSDGGWFWPCE